jgi:hypothetical protein
MHEICTQLLQQQVLVPARLAQPIMNEAHTHTASHLQLCATAPTMHAQGEGAAADAAEALMLAGRLQRCAGALC